MKPLSEILRIARLDAARAELAHLRVELDRQAREAAALARGRSAIRALIIEKLISTARLLQRSGEGQADAAVLHPAHLAETRPRSSSWSVSCSPICGTCGKDHHSARRRDVDQADDVLAAAELQHGGARDRRVARSRCARRSVRFTLRGIIPPSRLKLDATRYMPPHGTAEPSQRRLRIGLRADHVPIVGATVAGASLAGAVHRVYGSASGAWGCRSK